MNSSNIVTQHLLIFIHFDVIAKGSAETDFQYPKR